VPAEFFNVAVSVAGLDAEIAAEDVARTRVAGATVVVVVVDAAVPDPPPPQAVNRSARTMAKRDDIVRDELIFNMELPATDFGMAGDKSDEAQLGLRTGNSICPADTFIRVK
jgi:hypothetical protein